MIDAYVDLHEAEKVLGTKFNLRINLFIAQLHWEAVTFLTVIKI